MIGDCRRCGHSIMYHAPLIGCLKYSCGEFRVYLTAIIASLFMAGCTDETGSRKALNNAGFTDIQITGFEPFVCGKDDTYATGFTATNPVGRRVSGTVCCGVWDKGCTIRW